MSTMNKTIIGPSIVVEGEIEGSDAVVVQGIVRGRIGVEHGVTIEKGGQVEAEVETDAVQVAGSVEGAIRATQKVEITADGRVLGDIRAPRILIADGARFKGNIDMD